MEFDSSGYSGELINRNGIDFVVLNDVPPESWWRNFNFDSFGVDVRFDPSELKFVDLGILDRIRYLSVTRLGERSSDLSALPLLRSLVGLSVPVARRKVSVVDLPLEWFEGSARKLQGLFAVPTLTRMVLSEMPGGEIVSPVSDLGIFNVRNVDNLMLADPMKLRKLRIGFARFVDARFLSSAPGIEELIFWDCNEVTGLTCLSELAQLQAFTAVDVPKVDPVDALGLLSAEVEVSLGGITGFTSVASGSNVTPDNRTGILWHPALRKTFRVPDEVTYDEGLGSLVPVWWDELDDLQRTARLRVFVRAVLKRLEAKGLAFVEIDGVSWGLRELSTESLASTQADVYFFDKDLRLLGRSADTLSDGIYVYD